MTLVDFIELNDDIIDLSSDEETVQDDHAITQHGAISPDRQDMFVVAGEGSQDAQAVYIAASEGRQEATDSRNALEVTASSLVMEKSHLGMDGSQSCRRKAISPDRQDLFVLAGEGSQDAQAVCIAASQGRQEATDSRNALEVPASSLVREKSPLGMDESQSCPRSATSALFLSPTANTPKALTSEGGVAKRVRVKHSRKKNYHTSTPRRSPRFQDNPECCKSPVEELAAEQKSSRMLELAEEPARSTDNAEVV